MAYLKGLDVSKWQEVSDWVPTGLTFLFARASIGLQADVLYAAHMRKAKAAGLVTGAYHFNWDGAGTPEQQARYFVNAAGDVDFLFLDVEGASAFEEAESERFITECHRLGKKCGLYMSASSFRHDGQDYDWVAKWASTPPARGWEFWQYTSDGRSTDGTRMDLNYFVGTKADLLALSNREVNTSMALASFQSAACASTIPVLNGAKVYPNSDLTGTPITISPARSLDFVGTVGGGPRIVRFERRAGDTATYPIRDGWTGYVARTSCGTPVAKPDATPFSQHDVDAKVQALVDSATAGLTAQIADLSAAIGSAAQIERARIGEAERLRITSI
jgi:hypothetical protein